MKRKTLELNRENVGNNNENSPVRMLFAKSHVEGADEYKTPVAPGEEKFRSLQLLACCLKNAQDYNFPDQPITPVSITIPPSPNTSRGR